TVQHCEPIDNGRVVWAEGHVSVVPAHSERAVGPAGGVTADIVPCGNVSGCSRRKEPRTSAWLVFPRATGQLACRRCSTNLQSGSIVVPPGRTLRHHRRIRTSPADRSSLSPQ